MKRRRLAGLIAVARQGSPREAEIAAGHLSDLVSAGRLTNDEIAAIARESTEGVAAPPIASPEPWRSVVASAIAVVHGCRAFWRGGSLVFVGGDASRALSAYMRAVTEADFHAVGSFGMVEGTLPLDVEKTYNFIELAEALVEALAEAPVRRKWPSYRATGEAELLWMDLFRNAFASAVSDRLIGQRSKTESLPLNATIPKVPLEVQHGRALQERLGDANRVARVAERAESLGAAAGTRWRLMKRRLLMECRTCAELRATLGEELGKAVAVTETARLELDRARAAAEIARAERDQAVRERDEAKGGAQQVPGDLFSGPFADLFGASSSSNASPPSSPAPPSEPTGPLLEVD